MFPTSVSQPPVRPSSPPAVHHDPPPGTMALARNLIGTLAVLLLSTRLQAFSVYPFAKSSSSCRRAASWSPSNALASCSSRAATAAPSAWTGSRGREASCAALRMGAETIADVTTGDLSAREFQVCFLLTHSSRAHHFCGVCALLDSFVLWNFYVFF